MTLAPNCGSVLHTDADSQHVFSTGFEKHTPSHELALLCPLEVNCGGRRGKYVRVQLPGNKRILSLAKVEVHLPAPDPASHPSNAVVCYGVEARRGRSLPTPLDEYYTTDDPEDPAFYSTCYVRTEVINWLPTSVKPPPNVDDFHVHGKCIQCDDLTRNHVLTGMQAPIWDLDPMCLDCKAPPTGAGRRASRLAPLTTLASAQNADGIQTRNAGDDEFLSTLPLETKLACGAALLVLLVSFLLFLKCRKDRNKRSTNSRNGNLEMGTV